jgi:hypothetical protein
VLSFRNGAVVFEQPSPAIPMPESLARQLLTLPNADYSEWWVNWPSEQPDALSERNNRTIEELQSLSKVANFSW